MAIARDFAANAKNPAKRCSMFRVLVQLGQECHIFPNIGYILATIHKPVTIRTMLHSSFPPWII
jgi:hypothetical protein